MREALEEGRGMTPDKRSIIRMKLAAVFAILMFSPAVFAQNGPNPSGQIPKGAKVFIAPMPNDFDTFLKAAIEKKKVPVEIVTDKSKAEFQITGASESQKPGAAKIIITGNWHSVEDASIQVANLTSGEVVFAYSVHEQSSTHGRQSAAESCAKHLKEKIAP
jgi:hypothetical protein